MLNQNNSRGFGIFIPNRSPITLYKRQSNQTLGTTPVAWKIARRRNTTMDDLQGSGLTLEKGMTTFTLWNIEGHTGANLPDHTDVIQHADGTRWVISYIVVKAFDNLHSCVCIQELDT